MNHIINHTISKMHARARKAGRKDKSYKTKKRSIRNETEESIDYSEDEVN